MSSLEMRNRISLNNANDLADAIDVDMTKAVELNYNDSETIAIQVIVTAQMTALRARAAEIHQPIRRQGGDPTQPNIPPTPLHAVVNPDNPAKMVISFDANVVDDDGAGYSISGSTAATAITAVEALGSTLTLTLNGDVVGGETLLTSYAGTGGLANADYPSISAAAYTDFPVTNNVAA